MATKKRGGGLDLASIMYQVHDPNTGLFVMVDNEDHRAVAIKIDAGPFKGIRIKEAVDEAARASFEAVSREAARQQAERAAAEASGDTQQGDVPAPAPVAAESPVAPQAAAKKAPAKKTTAKKAAAKKPPAERWRLVRQL